MNKLLSILFLVVAMASAVRCDTKPVEQCEGYNFDNLSERITVSPCGNTKCKLTKLTNTTVAFKFRTDTEVKSLINKVYANIGGIPLPFLGVTEQSACGHIQRADTGESAPCPLAAGHEYVYQNIFPIHQFYPAVQLRVHWSLEDDLNDFLSAICFEVPAAIVNPKPNKANH